jgi:hypothetical protein
MKQKKLLSLFLILFLFGCGPTLKEKEEIAIITCNIMGESRNMDASMRIKEINLARDRIHEDAFLEKDSVIKESFEYDLCKELVMNDPFYREKINEIKRQDLLIIKEQEKQEQIRKTKLMKERESNNGLLLSNNSENDLWVVGKSVYEVNCLACHQRNGEGISDIFPALSGSDFAMNKEKNIEILMEGVQGAAMNSFSYLGDGEIASVITYISNSWGNDGVIIQPIDIANYREVNK